MSFASVSLSMFLRILRIGTKRILHVVPRAVMASIGGIGGRIAEAGRRSFREEGERIKSAFGRAMLGRAVVSEWRELEPGRHNPDCFEAVLEQARRADLIVASQADDDWEWSLLFDFPDRLALASGRPTLVVPIAGRFTQFGRRVVVAWNGTREAARAVFDALPMLQRAAAVKILTINPSVGSDTARTPGSDIAEALARHGVKCEAGVSISDDIEVGPELLSRLADYGADLLVMGCYGHSRFREFVFGGATREILRSMTVPVLMSH